jgi:hypothetical protein
MKGSYYNKERNVYRAFINIELQIMWLGTFRSDQEAHDYYVQAKEIYDSLDPSLTYEQVGAIIKSPPKNKGPRSTEVKKAISVSHLAYWKAKRESNETV